jgi:hypothetical protein
VTKFAEMVLSRQPSSTQADIDDKFSVALPVDHFQQSDVDGERENMTRLIEK